MTGGGVEGWSTDEGGRVQLRSLLTAMSGLAAEQWAPARVEQLLRLSVAVLDAEHAVLAVDGDDGALGTVLFSTADPLAVTALRDLLGAHLTAARPPAGPLFEAAAVVLPATTPSALVRPVLEVPMTVTSGGSGRLYVLGQAGRVAFDDADEEMAAEFAKMAALSVENALHGQQSRQQVKWLRGLTLITQALLQAGSDEVSVWQEIADRVHQLARARTVTIATVSEDDPDLLEVRVAAGVGAAQLPGRVFGEQDSLAVQAMAAGSWQVGTGGEEHTTHSRVGPPVGATLAIPLLDARGPRGAIVLSRHPAQAAFTRTEVAMVHDFANQAMLAIELAETRAAERTLSARTTEEEIAGTFQDRTIQRLFAASLMVEAAMVRRPEPWLTLLHAELAAVITEARSSLQGHYGRAG
ncbi:GAF domain-containing protein [Friedmanniella luteola]|uniref:GAF domain-containing protein n=1 Tax=Friedmanniella luteola TaxID=546871 RepID=A0A1H1WBB3_9ACTN|nr:GAF domain-containing protein [Friedmanniella luteola]SDS93940.1 GAF domain-containing protein [Friedmanniella luteola]